MSDGVRDVHRAVFDRDQHTLTLTVADVGTMAAAALEVVQPSLARRVEATRRVEVLRRDVGSVSATAARAADAIRLLAPLLLPGCSPRCCSWPRSCPPPRRCGSRPTGAGRSCTSGSAPRSAACC